VSVSRGDRRGSWRDRRRTGNDYVSKRTKAAHQSPIKLWPHLQAQTLLKIRRGSGPNTCSDRTAYASAPRSGGDPLLPRSQLPVT
jgi:hypothetical protein